MARKLLRDTAAVVAQILDGEHDDVLGHIQDAVTTRRKNLYRPGTQVRAVNTRNVDLEGQVGTVIKVNARRVTVGFGEHDQAWGTWEKEFNVPDNMLQVVK